MRSSRKGSRAAGPVSHTKAEQPNHLASSLQMFCAPRTQREIAQRNVSSDEGKIRGWIQDVEFGSTFVESIRLTEISAGLSELA